MFVRRIKKEISKWFLPGNQSHMLFLTRDTLSRPASARIEKRIEPNRFTSHTRRSYRHFPSFIHKNCDSAALGSRATRVLRSEIKRLVNFLHLASESF